MSKTDTIPTHLGLILDGNRRWAKAHGLPTLEGHRKGYDVFKKTVETSFKKGIKYVSAFIFSTENWSRTTKEVNYLMDLALKVFTKDLQDIHKQGVKILCLGTKDKLSKKHVEAIKKAEELTKNNTKGTLCVCFNYGGHQEIVDAVKKIVQSGMSADDISEDALAENLYHPEVPPVDFMIRTSGEQRTSNFMLWRLAYAELYFAEPHWPAFDETQLDQALAEYARRNRRFGGN